MIDIIIVGAVILWLIAWAADSAGPKKIAGWTAVIAFGFKILVQIAVLLAR